MTPRRSSPARPEEGAGDGTGFRAALAEAAAADGGAHRDNWDKRGQSPSVPLQPSPSVILKSLQWSPTRSRI